MLLLILIVSLSLALGAGYLFLWWWTKTKKEKIITALTEYGETEDNIKKMKTNMDKGDVAWIKQWKTENDTKITDNQTKLTNAVDNDKPAIQKKIDCLTELKDILQTVEKKEDFTKQVWGAWDYGYAGGIALVVFVLSFWICKMLFGTTKTGNE